VRDARVLSIVQSCQGNIDQLMHKIRFCSATATISGTSFHLKVDNTTKVRTDHICDRSGGIFTRTSGAVHIKKALGDSV